MHIKKTKNVYLFYLWNIYLWSLPKIRKINKIWKEEKKKNFFETKFTKDTLNLLIPNKFDDEPRTKTVNLKAYLSEEIKL